VLIILCALFVHLVSQPRKRDRRAPTLIACMCAKRLRGRDDLVRHHPLAHRRRSPAAPCRGRREYRAHKSAAPSRRRAPAVLASSSWPRSIEQRKCDDARRFIEMMQIIRLHPRFDQSAHQAPPASRRSSFTPFSSTVCASIGTPAVDNPRDRRARLVGQFARMVRVQHHVSRRALNAQRRHQIRRHPQRIDRGHARVCQRMIFTCSGSPPSRSVMSRARRAESRKGSPPVRITSQMPGVALDVGERRIQLRARSACHRLAGRPSRGESRSGSRPGTHARASASSAIRDSDARRPSPAYARSSPIGSLSSSGAISSSRASGRNCAAIGSSGLVGSISASIAGVIATA
jgi:hypothetical protein